MPITHTHTDTHIDPSTEVMFCCRSCIEMFTSGFVPFVSPGHAHLTDFNIATIIKDGERATALAGTKPYMGTNVIYFTGIFYKKTPDWNPECVVTACNTVPEPGLIIVNTEKCRNYTTFLRLFVKHHYDYLICKKVCFSSYQQTFSVLAFSPRDFPFLCKRRNGLRLWSRLVVTRGDNLWSAAWMGKEWCQDDIIRNCCKLLKKCLNAFPCVLPFYSSMPEALRHPFQ